MPDYFMIEYRKRILTPTDNSKKRCYNGCFHPSDWQETYTNWDWLSLKLNLEQAKEKLSFWVGLNDFAVQERGVSAKQEFRIVPDTVYDGTW